MVLLLVGARVLNQALRVSYGDLRSVLRELLGEGECGGEDLRARGEDGVVEAVEVAGGWGEDVAGEEDGGGA